MEIEVGKSNEMYVREKVEIRRLARLGQSNKIKALLLSQPQLELLALLKKQGRKGITSRELADTYKISIQNANSKLSLLEKKGYIYSIDMDHESGGKEKQFFYY